MRMDDPKSYHYRVILCAIEQIDGADRPLTLNELASSMSMSPSHFQRTFSQWVGVSPKRYQQYLTLGHAKQLLRNRAPSLETARHVGLSGASRLHDLFVSWEAMSPGQFAKSGLGLNIYHAWFESPFGDMLAMGTRKGLCGLAFATPGNQENVFDDLAGRWPSARLIPDRAPIQCWAEGLFRQRNNPQAILVGAPFHIKVWEALLNIPEGKVTTYSDIARAIGHPSAVRAVGSAVGRNPLGWLIPCHRVLRKDGELGGYHWGLPVKRAMLAWESARNDVELHVD